jgi:hypothetical protein
MTAHWQGGPPCPICDVDEDAPETFQCEGCQQTIPEDDRSECPHFVVCQGCQDEGYCLECLREDHFYDEVDRVYAAHKDGDRW